MHQYDEARAKLILERLVIDYGDNALVDQLQYIVSLTRYDDTPMLFGIALKKGYGVSDHPDGPLNKRAAYVNDEGEMAGLIMVFVRGGALSHIEAPWTTDNMPDRWPAIDAVKLNTVS